MRRMEREHRMRRITFAACLAAVAASANGGKWRLILAEGGKALKFGPMRGTQFLLK